MICLGFSLVLLAASKGAQGCPGTGPAGDLI
jgi:hypothetical protein